MGTALGVWSSRHAQRCALLLLLAWLPTLTFVGHWEALAAPLTSAGGPAATHAHASPSGASDREHAAHCHTGFDECGGGASAVTMPAGSPAHARGHTPEAHASDRVVGSDLAISGFESSPLTPPPRRAV